MTVEDTYVEVNGIRIHALRAGAGARSIVLCHGNSHCAGVWLPLIEALATDFTVVATDLRGHGWSDKPEDGYNWTQLRDDLVAVVTALELRDILYVAHSRGGGVSLLAAAATLDRARGVVAYEPTVPVQVDGAGRPAPVHASGQSRQMAERAQRRRDSFPDRAALAAHYRRREGFRHWRKDYFDAFIHYGTVEQEDGSAAPCVPPRVAARLFEATFGFAPWGDVRAPELPVQVVFGDQGGRLGPGRDPAAPIRALFPRLETGVMQSATHTGPMEHPEEWEQLIRAFSERCAPPATPRADA